MAQVFAAQSATQARVHCIQSIVEWDPKIIIIEWVKCMNIETEHRGDILIVRPLGRLDSSNSPEFEHLLSGHLDAGCQRLVLDLSRLGYISSAGLRVVLLAGKKLRASQGKMVLTSLQDMVRDVFDMSGFLALFAVAKTLDEGLGQV